MAKKKVVVSKERLKKLYHIKGLSVFKIADILGCSAGTVLNRMREYNISRRHAGPKRIKIKKEVLLALYKEKGLSSRKIANIYHCDQGVILRALKKFGVSVRRPTRPLSIQKQILKYLYIEQKLSTYSIGKRYGCSSSTIYKYLKLYNIPTRPPRRVQISEEKLKFLYLEKKYPISKIAKLYECTPTVVLYKMRRNGIPRRSVSEAMTKHPKNNFSKNLEEKAYLIGFRIGDLHIRKNGNIIKAGCGSTKMDQIRLIESLFASYGPGWRTKPDKAGRWHIDFSLNNSFKFLLPKYKTIPKWITSRRKFFLSFLAGYTDAEGNIGVFSGRARFRLRSYDKGILFGIHKELLKIGIKSKFSLELKAHISSTRVQHKDCWGVSVNEHKSLQKLFEIIDSYMKHKKRKKDLARSYKNVCQRIKTQKN